MTITIKPNPIDPTNRRIALMSLTAMTVNGPVTIPQRMYSGMSKAEWRQYKSHNPRPRYVTDSTSGISTLTF